MILYFHQLNSISKLKLGEKKLIKEKKIISAALITLLTFSILMTSAITVDALEIEYDTYLWLSVSPDPVQVNNEVLVSIQLDKVSPTVYGTSEGDFFEGYTVTITKPDGTKETKGPYKAQATSGAFFSYTPTQMGTYTFQAFFPGQWINGSYSVSTPVGWLIIPGLPLHFEERWYEPSNSAPVVVVVQDEQIETIQDVPFPTEPWQRPIYGENKGWGTTTDNWLLPGYDKSYRMFNGHSAFAPYTTAPNSPHILWTNQIEMGGIVGGIHGDKTYYPGLSYEQNYIPLILNGQIIYLDHGPTTDVVIGTRCISLYTGEQLWYLEDAAIVLAQTLDIENPNEHGLIPYLWAISGFPNHQTWTMYDAYSANSGQPPEPYLTINNVPANGIPFGMMGQFSVDVTTGPNGELLAYLLDTSYGWLSMWNSTKAIVEGAGYQPGAGEQIAGTWNPARGSVIDGALGIEWNVTIPTTGFTPLSIKAISIEENAILATGVTDESVFPHVFTHAAYPALIQKNQDGSYPASISPLWSKERTNLQREWLETQWNINEGRYCLFDASTLELHGYDIKTGQELWVGEPITSEMWGMFTHTWMAYGKLYAVGYDGVVRAFDAATGELVWDYSFESAGYETPYGTYPNYDGFTIADGKVYLTNDEHSPDATRWRGSNLWCLDAETGDLLWKISGSLRQAAISDGILTSYNSLDGKAYTFGKGLSKTTVSAPQTQVTLGENLMITGTVTDQSPGQPNTACISDEDMGDWMAYLHMQKPIPSDAKGVEVSIDVIDSNGNFRNIGTATSDTTGTFGYMWEPDIPGQYTVIATFAGTESYGSSFAQTYMGVVDVPQPTPEPTPTPAPMTDTYVVGTGIAVIAAVAIGVLLLLRKK